MADPKKVSWAQLRIGIMAAVAMTILGVLIFLLTGTGGIFTSWATLYTYMGDSAAMATNTPVRLNGISIGKIDEIRFSGLKEKGKIVVIKMQVKKDMLSQIPEDSKVGVDAANLLGEKFVNITKGESAVPVKDGAYLQSEPVSDIPELMTRAGDILGGFQQMVKRFDVILGDIEAGRGNVGKLIKDEQFYNELTAAVAEARKVVTAINNGKGILPRLINDEQFVEEIRSPIRRVDSLVADLEAGKGTLGKLLKDPALHDQTVQTVADIRRLINVDFKKIVDDLNAGKGTAGKLLKDDELYQRINQVVAKLDTSIDKLNSGQGTLGQLIVNPAMYDSLTGATREAQALLKDIRANPKKFLRIKLGLF
jgi:phospholipid/cholesterol/gamma-HCH transport system substrate-binding protein